jgi:hypothetical protein
MFVLDEADEMLNLGGLGDQSKRIRLRLRKDVQTLFFSATYTSEVKRLATQLSMDNPWSQIEVRASVLGSCAGSCASKGACLRACVRACKRELSVCFVESGVVWDWIVPLLPPTAPMLC